MTYDPYQHQQRMQDIPPQGYWPQQQPAPQPRHRRPRGLWVAVIAVLVIAAAGSTAWALGGSSSAAKPTCHQQYLAWKNGPARSYVTQTFLTDDKAVVAATNSEDIPASIAALKKLGQDGATMQQWPIPACADPAGYWAQVLSDLKSAGDNAGTASGFSAIMVAAAPLENIQPLFAKLSAEVKRTTGVKG